MSVIVAPGPYALSARALARDWDDAMDAHFARYRADGDARRRRIQEAQVRTGKLVRRGLFDIYALVTIEEANGRVGPLHVHGRGGALRWSDLNVMVHAFMKANRGERLSIAEGGRPPERKQGHVWAYRGERHASVDLRGAALLAWEGAPERWAAEMGLLTADGRWSEP